MVLSTRATDSERASLLGVAASLAVVLVVMAATLAVLVMSQHSNTTRSSAVTVYDRPSLVMQVYYQTDSAWSGAPYLGGTIGSHGCGLVCATMALQYFTGDQHTPDTVASIVGDTCSTDGVNDMRKFGSWLSSMIDGCMSSGMIWTIDGIKQADLSDAVIFCGMSGLIGKTMYTSHVVMLYCATSDGAYMADPYDSDNTRWFKWDELDDIGFLYFVIVRCP